LILEGGRDKEKKKTGGGEEGEREGNVRERRKLK